MSELEALRLSTERTYKHRRVRGRASKRMGTLSEMSGFSKTVLEELESLSNLSREELKSQSARILTLRKGEEYDTQGVKYRTILTLIAELEPDWVLRQLEERELGTEYHWGGRGLSGVAFEIFLRIDALRALAWYESGVEERSGENFAKFSLCRLAVGELLKTDPKRALAMMKSDSRYFPRFVRLEGFDQVSKCRDLLPQLESEFNKRRLRELVASETYRLGGVAALQRLMDSEGFSHEGDQDRYAILNGIGNIFRSEEGMRDLRYLTQGAPEKIRAEILGALAGRWGYDDSVAAEKYILTMPPGEAKQLALSRLVSCKTEYDPDAVYRLLSQIEDEGTRNELQELLEKKLGFSRD